MSALKRFMRALHAGFYNVHMVAAFSPETMEVLNGFTSTLFLKGRWGRHNFYEVKNPSTWFHEGSGRLQFDNKEGFNSVRIFNGGL